MAAEQAIDLVDTHGAPHESEVNRNIDGAGKKKKLMVGTTALP
jgi:hypothetical protein